MTIQEGNTVIAQYEGKLEDGTVFDSSEKHGKPLEFTVGKGQVVKGFEQAVVGMKAGEVKEVTITPEQAYGERNDKMIHEVPREQLPKEQTPEVGMVLGITTPDGKQFPAKIAQVTDKIVKLDLNHPLAGKTLMFKITIEEVKTE
ncbi:MAG: peptidylprolyl isomerase [Candidatus Woesearchaeota archaeon]|jgi:peptidylprolyl isomerase